MSKLNFSHCIFTEVHRHLLHSSENRFYVTMTTHFSWYMSTTKLSYQISIEPIEKNLPCQLRWDLQSCPNTAKHEQESPEHIYTILVCPGQKQLRAYIFSKESKIRYVIKIYKWVLLINVFVHSTENSRGLNPRKEIKDRGKQWEMLRCNLTTWEQNLLMSNTRPLCTNPVSF